MENFLFEAITQLVVHKVEFVICGGIACILHGSKRTSFDLDISVSMNEKNLQKIISTAKLMNWVPRVPEPIEYILDPQKRKEWIEEKGARVFTLNSSDGFLQIDVFLTYPISFELLKKDAVLFEVDGIRFPVSSIQHLLQAKKSIESKRREDVYDIEMLEEIIYGNRI